MNFTERIILTRLVFGIVFYGIHTITFCTFVYYTYFDNYRSSRTRWMHIIAWTIYALGTANFISTTLFSVRAWNYAHSHGSDAIAWMNENSKHPAHTIEYSSSILAFVLQDSLMLYRLNIIYHRCKYRVKLVVFFSFAIFLTTVHGVLWILQTTYLMGVFGPAAEKVFGIVHCVTSSFIHAAMTIVIAIRLLNLRRSILDVTEHEHTKLYISLTAILVESGAMHTVAMSVCFLPLNYPLGAAPTQVTGIAACLIAIRMTRGRALTEDVIDRTQSSLRFTASDTTQSATQTLQTFESLDQVQWRRQ